MEYDYQWHIRFNACVATCTTKGVVGIVIKDDVYIETPYHSYKLTREEAQKFIGELNAIAYVCGHNRAECALYLTYEFIGAVIPNHN